uniref:RRM domain-containing protein n=1 Tax=Panagrellus redivivus TaxID=6233 RepID=A0A7E4VSI4_PANRE
MFALKIAIGPFFKVKKLRNPKLHSTFEQGRSSTTRLRTPVSTPSTFERVVKEVEASKIAVVDFIMRVFFNCVFVIAWRYIVQMAYALVGPGNDASVALLSTFHNVVQNAPTIDGVIDKLLENKLITSGRSVFVHLPPSLEDRLSFVHALQKAGFTNIEGISPISLNVTSTLMGVHLSMGDGKEVFVLRTDDSCFKIDVILRCDNRWKIVEEGLEFNQVKVRYPLVRDLVVSRRFRTKSAVHEAFLETVSGNINVHFSHNDYPDMAKLYVLNQTNGTPMNAFLSSDPLPLILSSFKASEVLPYCGIVLTVKFGEESRPLSLTHRVPPFTLTDSFDIGTAKTVEIHGNLYKANKPAILLKTFTFEGDVHRTVVLTVDVDKTLLPQIKLTTVDTDVVAKEAENRRVEKEEKQREAASLANLFDKLKSLSQRKIAVIEDGNHVCLYSGTKMEVVIDEADSPNLAVAALLEVAPPESVACVYVTGFKDDLFSNRESTVKELQAAGYTNIESVEELRMDLFSNVSNLTLNCAIGEPVFVGSPFHFPLDEFRVTVLLKRDKGYQVVNTDLDLPIAISHYPSVRNVVISKETPDSERAEIVKLLPGRKLHNYRDIDFNYSEDFLQKRINEDAFNGNDILPFCYCDVVIGFGDNSKVIHLADKTLPFTTEKEVDVGDASEVTVTATSRVGRIYRRLKTLKFKNKALRKVYVTVHVDKLLLPKVTIRTASTYKPPQLESDSPPKTVLTSTPANCASTDLTSSSSKRLPQPEAKITVTAKDGTVEESATATDKSASRDAADVTDRLGTNLQKELLELNLDPPPTTILTFTSDNRVLIEADETYTGDTEVLAYVRLQSGKVPKVGRQAFDALKKHPCSVFYDIPRLLATDFDPDRPDPSWGFKTTRDADGKVLVHGGDGITTFPIVLFGSVVMGTLKYIKQHLKSEV